MVHVPDIKNLAFAILRLSLLTPGKCDAEYAALAIKIFVPFSQEGQEREEAETVEKLLDQQGDHPIGSSEWQDFVPKIKKAMSDLSNSYDDNE
jgi:hypothetical protein